MRLKECGKVEYSNRALIDLALFLDIYRINRYIHNMKAPIEITSAAAERIKTLLHNRGKKSAGIKVGVKKGGCSGLSYVIEYADEIGKFDEIISYPQDKKDNNTEEDGFKVIIDPKAIIYLIGTIMDYTDDKFKSGFTFRNPNEKGRCGCEESFHV